MSCNLIGRVFYFYSVAEELLPPVVNRNIQTSAVYTNTDPVRERCLTLSDYTTKHVSHSFNSGSSQFPLNFLFTTSLLPVYFPFSTSELSAFLDFSAFWTDAHLPQVKASLLANG